MKRMLVVLLVAAAGLQIAEPALAHHTAKVVRRGPKTRVVVHRTHPIRRAPVVVVHPARHAVVVRPARFLPAVLWAALIVTIPARDALVWEDSERFSRSEDWVDMTLNVEERGTRLFLEIDGKAQLNFAEVVFENGDAQVVDFREYTRGPGVYSLLDFEDGRRVDHVRVVARAKSEHARITVRMAK